MRQNLVLLLLCSLLGAACSAPGVNSTNDNLVPLDQLDLVGEIFAGTRINGFFADASRPVGYRFEGVQYETVNLALDALEPGHDPVLFLYGPRDESGSWTRVVATNDDGEGVKLNARIFDVRLTEDGEYLVVVSEYSGGGGSADDLHQTYGFTATQLGTSQARGEWALGVRDRETADTGTLDSFRLTFSRAP